MPPMIFEVMVPGDIMIDSSSSFSSRTGLSGSSFLQESFSFDGKFVSAHMRYLGF
jgi:hypothetical protein